MEGLIILDTDNGGAGDNKAKGEKIAKGLSIGSNSRKRLADISNLQQQRPKPSIQQVKQQFDSDTNKEYIDNLQKENRTLMKLLTDRKYPFGPSIFLIVKIIELSRVEIQNLRINLQKVQQQNLQLAQANSQILGELNLGKDRLKALQHEIGCKNGLLKVRKLEAEVEGLTKCFEAGESLQADKKDGPFVASHTVEAVEVKEKADNKRGLRRQSARFKTEEREATEEMLETNGCKIPVLPLCNNMVHESETTFSSVEKEAPTIEAVQANKKAYHKRRFTRQSAKLKTEEQEATEEMFETNGDKIPLSLLRDNVVHASETICPLGGKDDTTSAAVQAKEKAYNNRRFTRQSAKLKTEVQEAPEGFGTNGEKFHVSHLCHNVVHGSAPTCSVLETEDPITEAVQAKEKADNKRQSARFKTEELFETNEDTVHVYPLSDDVVHESGSTCSSVKKEDEGYTAPRSEGQECRRSSARPLRRRATQAIKSYKETPVNVKMRREN
ncbi:hypothetical protein DVH24_023885 [Malus domestica]|uniref:Uncharacterized protein n=1 Tax=Malus domestica TaxID=3750 RepID=A0A498JLK0_MALDO|nr:hypothetical protein DVH24_023885 [Malus domestica]